MDSEERKAGRDRVRSCLFDLLDQAGLVRKRGVSAEAHDQARKRLIDHLAYMDEANLLTLAEVVMDHADGPQQNVMPAEVTIRNLAHGLQAPPFAEKRIVSSWLASVEGPIAEASGHLVELYRFLRANGRPPMAFDLTQIKERAGNNQRQRQLVGDRIERAAASAADREWLEAYLQDERAARALVAQGQDKREAAHEDA
ncbi:hypothetical protein [Tranquillimonas rosea]|uniref:hypothetical protein n=1 Tax=Tranquillimonas rosea TaxID=641238 RepID=UPI003BA9172F